MHSIAASTALRDGVWGLIGATGSFLVCVGANAPLACCHFSKNGCMSVVRSLITGKFASGPICRLPVPATLATWVRQVQRGLPLTVIAHEPQTPTRQAKRYDKVGSIWRCTKVTTSRTVWLARCGTR